MYVRYPKVEYTLAQKQIMYRADRGGTGFGLADIKAEGAPSPSGWTLEESPVGRILERLGIHHWSIWDRWDFTRRVDFDGWYDRQLAFYCAWHYPDEWEE